jgi:hypothetical protein
LGSTVKLSVQLVTLDIGHELRPGDVEADTIPEWGISAWLHIINS